MRTLTIGFLGTVALAAAITALACGGGGSSTPTTPSPSPSPSPTASPTPSPAPSPSPSPSPAPSNEATITITRAGASPRSVTITAGGRVTFVNNDTQPHDMSSDPHPEHTTCPAINQAGFLSAGQSRQTGNLTVVRTCGFHDHDQPNNTTLRGTIIIQ